MDTTGVRTHTVSDCKQYRVMSVVALVSCITNFPFNIYLPQMKYECAVRHGVKVVTPDWLIDSINMDTLVEEGDYCPRGRGRGNHTHTAEQGVVEVVQCNGKLTGDPLGDHQGTTAVVGGPETTETRHKDHDQTTANYTVANVPVPTETTHIHVCVHSPKLSHNQQTAKSTEEVKTAATSDSVVPPQHHRETTDAEGGWESGDGEGGEEMEIVSGEGELGEESAVVPAPAASGDVTPPVSATNSTTALQNGLTADRATTAATSHHGAPGAESGGTGEYRLLAGLTFHLTGYLEYMEEDTLAKWKEVSSTYYFSMHSGSVCHAYFAD